MTDDAELLRRYAEEGAEDAFGELVQRHLAFVYHAALRQVAGDANQAKEVAQRVFTNLARKAARVAAEPALIDWLHTTARDAATAGARGAKRAPTAHGPILAADVSPATATEWERLQPVIDEALDALNARDREAVLLRFFEGRPYSEIGDRLFVTEDAARVRVDRALEKLAAILARRGVASTAAALAVALEQRVDLAVPTGLAGGITAAALAGATAGGAGLAEWSFLTTAKFAAGLAGALALLAIGTAAYQAHKVSTLEIAAAAAQEEAADLRGRLQQFEARLDAEIRRAQAADEDNARLLEAMDRLAEIKLDEGVAAGDAEEPVTPESVSARFKRAAEFVRAGRPNEALWEYLWCYDDGMPRFATFYGLRNGSLLGELAELAKRHPPAREALRARRDQAEQRMRAGAADREAAADFAALNDALGDGARTLAEFEKLGPGDPRREGLGSSLFELLVAQKRYSEAMQARSYANMRSTFDLMTVVEADASSPRTGDNDSARTRSAQREAIVKATARDIEVLAGAGELENARALAGSLLEFDGSAGTRTLLQEHLARAGQPALLGK